ncbi:MULTISPECIES: hypothetical protein [unclassified Caballeronia]|uniref:hypothetical protein n=1 Tax=unclassified Caballeronia TaxID=2646786 RepID=UPI002028E9A1|nr:MULTISPECIES: hypothetical protein [unclassified Caballeronia]MDR5792218.1 hypothetical protein [Caballeronia sp. LZ008]
MTGLNVQFLRNHRAQTNANQASTHAVTVETRYLRLPDDTHGWIDVIIEATRDRVSLCEYTKVALVKDDGERTYFRIQDGSIAVGQLASMKSSAAKAHFKKTAPTVATNTVSVKYGTLGKEDSPFKGRLRQQWATLNVGGEAITVTLNSVWNEGYTPIASGRHRIMSPDRSHANVSTEGYRNSYPGRIKANDVWFPIELEGGRGNSSRYVHIGHLSEGCVTVHDIVRWNLVYNYLISHRLPDTDGKYVALLDVDK